MSLPPPLAPPGIVVPAPRDDLCLDFANTRYWRGSDPATETLNAPADLIDWAASAGADPVLAAALRRRWEEDPEGAVRAFERTVREREAIYGVFAALAAGGGPAEDDLEALNVALARAPARGRLAARDGRFAWHIASPLALETILAPIFWSAGDLLTGTRLGRVRQCANPQCRWLFLDDSKSANRRWCAMSQCGNRAKAHRHYMRRKQQAEDRNEQTATDPL